MAILRYILKSAFFPSGPLNIHDPTEASNNEISYKDDFREHLPFLYLDKSEGTESE